MQTLIELLADALQANADVAVDTVLVPEQCMLVYVGEKQFHITVQELSIS